MFDMANPLKSVLPALFFVIFCINVSILIVSIFLMPVCRLFPQTLLHHQSDFDFQTTFPDILNLENAYFSTTAFIRSSLNFVQTILRLDLSKDFETVKTV